MKNPSKNIHLSFPNLYMDFHPPPSPSTLKNPQLINNYRLEFRHPLLSFHKQAKIGEFFSEMILVIYCIINVGVGLQMVSRNMGTCWAGKKGKQEGSWTSSMRSSIRQKDGIKF
jgi:hypothetical protein